MCDVFYFVVVTYDYLTMYFLLLFSCWNKIVLSLRTDSLCRGVGVLACGELHGHGNTQRSNISGAHGRTEARALVDGTAVSKASFVVASFVVAEIEIQSSFAVGVGVAMVVLVVAE